MADTTTVYLDASEAAEYTRRSRSLITDAARAGELRGAQAKRKGKWTFRTTDLDRWLEGKPPLVDAA